MGEGLCRGWLAGVVAVMAAIPLTSLAASDDQQFFRIMSVSTTEIRSISSGGTIGWSNTVTPNTCTVETADNLLATNAWRPYVRADVGTKMFSLQIFDPNTPAGMMMIPEGPFMMGNTFTDHDCGTGGEIVEFPVHAVYVSRFYIETREVTKAIWDPVYAWSLTNGYNYSAGCGCGKATNYPAGSNNWYDCVKWCNARSEMCGLTPCYYTEFDKTNLYRAGELDISPSCVKWTVDGYRLPTEAEWEKACRGGLVGTRFPWGDTITHSNANYCSYEYFSFETYTNTPLCFYDVSPTRGYHPVYSNTMPYTAPVGQFEPNGYRLYDMSGNVNEWCWDWYGKQYYASSPSTDPRGPADASPENGTNRILRGGGWLSWDASLLRCAYRMGNPPAEKTENRGFRCVRSHL